MRMLSIHSQRASEDTEITAENGHQRKASNHEFDRRRPHSIDVVAELRGNTKSFRMIIVALRRRRIAVPEDPRRDVSPARHGLRYLRRDVVAEAMDGYAHPKGPLGQVAGESSQPLFRYALHRCMKRRKQHLPVVEERPIFSGVLTKCAGECCVSDHHVVGAALLPSLGLLDEGSRDVEPDRRPIKEEKGSIEIHYRQGARPLRQCDRCREENPVPEVERRPHAAGLPLSRAVHQVEPETVDGRGGNQLVGGFRGRSLEISTFSPVSNDEFAACGCEAG